MKEPLANMLDKMIQARPEAIRDRLDFFYLSPAHADEAAELGDIYKGHKVVVDSRIKGDNIYLMPQINFNEQAP